MGGHLPLHAAELLCELVAGVPEGVCEHVEQVAAAGEAVGSHRLQPCPEALEQRLLHQRRLGVQQQLPLLLLFIRLLTLPRPFTLSLSFSFALTLFSLGSVPVVSLCVFVLSISARPLPDCSAQSADLPPPGHRSLALVLPYRRRRLPLFALPLWQSAALGGAEAEHPLKLFLLSLWAKVAAELQEDLLLLYAAVEGKDQRSIGLRHRRCPHQTLVVVVHFLYLALTQHVLQRQLHRLCERWQSYLPLLSGEHVHVYTIPDSLDSAVSGIVSAARYVARAVTVLITHPVVWARRRTIELRTLIMCLQSLVLRP
mmetsp:Transcript_7165/g.30516  ORF Transcript_7165/g.30516 Transcript_7165/m.30516 type:complete len:313 (-) Transcript_7165:107-1045(-)